MLFLFSRVGLLPRISWNWKNEIKNKNKNKKLLCLWRFDGVYLYYNISIILLWFLSVILDSGDAFISYNAIEVSSLLSDC